MKTRLPPSSSRRSALWATCFENQLGPGTAIFLSALLVLVVIPIVAKKFHPLLYWHDRCLDDGRDDHGRLCNPLFGDWLRGGSLILFACLMAVLGLWYWSLGSISVTTVNTPKVEAFYWAAITFSQTLGTALGDWMADGGLGYAGAALVFGAGLAVLAAAYSWTSVSRVLLFWATFILTREEFEARQGQPWSGFLVCQLPVTTPRRTWRRADVVAQRPSALFHRIPAPSRRFWLSSARFATWYGNVQTRP